MSHTTRRWPKEELYGLTDQVRRAAVSVPSNIAEGQGRGVVREFVHYLRIARGSLFEVETQVIIAERLGYVDRGRTKELLTQVAEVSRLLSGLLRSLDQPST
ncbi:MAG TPA: four helix bundle protein [Chloroflexia bacterium]|jgi:four helix bundle protein|nr:four helix bundle protein [Chloroflexia bacterium]